MKTPRSNKLGDMRIVRLINKESVLKSFRPDDEHALERRRKGEGNETAKERQHMIPLRALYSRAQRLNRQSLILSFEPRRTKDTVGSLHG